MVVDGGRVAAWGFRYQYLRTIEAALAAVDDDRFVACRVEGGTVPDESGQVEVVDFDLIGPDEEILVAVQVKTGGPTARLGIRAVVETMVELVTRCEAERYELLANMPLAEGAQKVADVLARTDLSVSDRRAQLAQALAAARSTRDIADVTDDRVERLGRCRVVLDPRGRTAIADDVKTQVWDFRRKMGRGIGSRSAGLLLTYLLAEVQRRAAFAEDAVWTKADIVQAVIQDERAVVDVLGSRDWGSMLGLMAPVPDLPRPGLIGQIATNLEPYRSTGRSVRCCTLTGLSGIGKSSLAAAYVATYADAYTAIYWIDATSPDSLDDGFRTLAARLGLVTDASTSEQLRLAVHEALSIRPGRFLLVFDDAVPNLVHPWIPRLADGDVLVTTIDGTARLGPIEVTTLTIDEAVDLIYRRLDEPAAESDNAARRLATALECWPLALELATAYLRSCGFNLDEVDHYLTSLTVRSFGDRHCIPDGYPRTLEAAIELSLEALFRSNTADANGLAVKMLRNACYVSGRRVPIHLLAAAATAELDTIPENAGPAVIESPLVHEAVRALFRISFVRRDERLARRDGDLPTSEHTVAINAVLQEVLRAGMEAGPVALRRDDDLRRLALHVNQWLSAAAHNREMAKTHQLYPHAAALVAHLRRLDITGGRIALLTGNLAAGVAAAGRDDEAIDLLQAEIDMVVNNPDGPDIFVEHQARLALAGILARCDQTTPLEPHPAVSHLERVLTYVQTLALGEEDAQAAAAKLCVFARSALTTLHDRQSATSTTRALFAVFCDLQKRLPKTDITNAADVMERIDDLISGGDDGAAEVMARELLSHTYYGSSVHPEIRRRLVETLVAQGKWQDCHIEIDALARDFGNPPIARDSAQWALHNIGLKLVCSALVNESSEPRVLLHHLLQHPCFAHVNNIARGEYRASFDLYLLAAVVFSGDTVDIRDGLARVNSTANQRFLAREEHWRDLATEITTRARRRLGGHGQRGHGD